MNAYLTLVPWRSEVTEGQMRGGYFQDIAFLSQTRWRKPKRLAPPATYCGVSRFGSMNWRTIPGP